MSAQPPSPKGSGSREIKSNTPPLLAAGIVTACLVLLVAIFWSLSQLQTQITDAKLTGTIIEKNFTPNPRQEVMLDRHGGMQVRHREGDYSILVRVKHRDGTLKDYKVTNLQPEVFEKLEVGQRFDVGPYLVPSVAEENSSDVNFGAAAGNESSSEATGAVQSPENPSTEPGEGVGDSAVGGGTSEPALDSEGSSGEGGSEPPQ